MADFRWMRGLAAAAIAASFALAGSLDAVATDTTVKDTIWRDPGRSASSAESDSTQSLRYEKRAYDHRQQVIVAGSIMFCVALALVAMNNYNPRR